MMKRIFYIAGFIFTSQLMLAQVQLTPVLVGSTGNFSQPSFGSISSSVGEPVTTTLSPGSKHLTQGFQQPLNTFKIKVFAINATCSGGENGSAYVEIEKGKEPFTYEWSSTTQVTDSVIGLREGKYIVKVTDSRGTTKVDSVVVGADSPVACELKIYSGFSPNSDAKNDTWIIDNIGLYPANSVTIFTRWGDKVWDNEGYDNASVVWAGTNNSGANLPDGTYFYIVEINKTKYEGWVQITR